MNFSCFVDRASVYSPVTKPTCRTFFSHQSVHVSGCFGRSTGETTVFMGHFVLVFLCGCLSGIYQTVIHTEKHSCIP